jgi:hypothetical protein
MKTLVVACLFALLLGGLVTAALLGTSMESAPLEATAATPAGPVADDSLRESVAALAERVDTMAMSIETLEHRLAQLGEGGGARVAADAVQREEIDELRGLLTAVRDPETGADQLEGLVLNVLEAKEDRDREERDERRREAMEERMDERVAKLTEELGLNGYQAGEMKRILTDEQTTRDEFFTKMREGGNWDREAMRDSMEEIRTTSRTALQTVLSASQYDQYVEQDSGFGGFGRRGGGGDDNNNNGGEGGGRRGR